MNRKTIYSSQLNAAAEANPTEQDGDDLDMDKIKIKKDFWRENEECVAWGTWKNIKVTFGFYCNFLLLYSSEFSFSDLSSESFLCSKVSIAKGKRNFCSLCCCMIAGFSQMLLNAVFDVLKESPLIRG